MSNSAILNAFIGQLVTALPVAYPGIAFTPPDTGEWLEISFFPNPTSDRFLGSTDPVLYQGIFQIAVCYRPGTGVITGAQTAETIIAQYTQDLELAGVNVEIKPWDSGPIIEDHKITHPVTIRYRGYI